MYNSDASGAAGCFLFVIMIIIVMIVSVPFNLSDREVTFRVEDKWIDPHSSSSYLVSDPSGNIYTVGDSLSLLRFDASDRWLKIEAGKTYKFTVYGWRVRLFSTYPTIIGIEPIIS
jgi:hypothetical protein